MQEFFLLHPVNLDGPMSDSVRHVIQDPQARSSLLMNQMDGKFPDFGMNDLHGVLVLTLNAWWGLLKKQVSICVTAEIYVK